ncbi:LysE family translocator, partial [bacterium]|nr:LysE family translocator [bacterium]
VVVETTPLMEIFKQGMLTNILNPKVALFFVAFLPQFVDPASDNVALQLAGLGIMFDILGTAVNLLIAYAASYAGERMKQKMRSSGFLNKFTGLIMIFLGLRLAVVNKK